MQGTRNQRRDLRAVSVGNVDMERQKEKHLESIDYTWFKVRR